jgi:phosphoglycolate phosphatase-like HAD superfamily hydrolase
MNLVVLDVDGTLVKPHARRSDRAFVRAVKEVLGLDIKDSREGFKSTTDLGVLEEIIQSQLGQEAGPGEIEDFKAHMAPLLAGEYGGKPFQAMEGAKEFWTLLAKKGGWCRALATADFEVAGRFKLTSAGLDMANAPMGSADDGPRLELALAAAENKALEIYKVKGFKKIIYVADTALDFQTAGDLGWDFIGMGRGKTRKGLEEAGVPLILDDFRRLNDIL